LNFSTIKYRAHSKDSNKALLSKLTNLSRPFPGTELITPFDFTGEIDWVRSFQTEQGCFSLSNRVIFQRCLFRKRGTVACCKESIAISLRSLSERRHNRAQAHTPEVSMDSNPAVDIDKDAALARFQVAMDNYRAALRQRSSKSRNVTFVNAINWVHEAHTIAQVLDQQEAFKQLCDAYTFILVSAAMECQKQAICSGNIWQIHDQLSTQIQLCSQLLVAAYEMREHELPRVRAIVVRGLAVEARTLVVNEKGKPLSWTDTAALGPMSGLGVETEDLAFSGTTDAAVLDDFLRLMAALIENCVPLGRAHHECYRDENDVWLMINDAVENASLSLVWFFDSENSPWRLIVPKQDNYSWAKSRVWIKWADQLLDAQASLSGPDHAQAATGRALKKAAGALQRCKYAESKKHLKEVTAELRRRGVR
jgi:hypothetical protein